ncbi:glycosyltransferase family 4 protein [Spirosoma harenae]
MNILYLTFYFEPDIGPGAFRNTTLVKELASQLTADDSIQVITTQPNRYKSYRSSAPVHENRIYGECPVAIHRIDVPTHKSGFLDQILAFYTYYKAVHQLTRKRQYNLIFASSSRLFTAFLGAAIGRPKRIPLFLDIRDLFREAILNVLRKRWFNLPITILLNPILWLIEQYTFRYARHINLVSEGFRPYFRPFSQASFSYCTNGIDQLFLDYSPVEHTDSSEIKTILYAGNIGEGQALHSIIPELARQVGNTYRFVIIGDGGAIRKLEMAIYAANVTNIDLRLPVHREALLMEYRRADYLFLHLADLKTCERVIPSKLFEYGATDKPIIAGVSGYAAAFIQENLPNSIVFNPGDVADLIQQLRNTLYCTQPRNDFVRQFNRRLINQELAEQIIQVGESSMNVVECAEHKKRPVSCN